MKVLFVAPWIPSAIRPRSLALLDMLAADHDVRFLALARHAAEAQRAYALPVARPTVVRNDLIGSMLRTLRALGSGVSLQQAYASPRALRLAFERELDAWQPDLVHLNVFRTVHLVESGAGTPVIIDLDEFRSEYYEQLAAHGPSLPWRALGRVEAGRMRAREDALVRMGVPMMVSAPLPPGQERPNTVVVRSPCDFPLRSARAAAPIVLFVGRLTYEANVSGLAWFVRACWAGIRRAVPDATLRIVGSDPPRRIRSLLGDGVELYANVADVEPHYAAASVAIAPIVRGTGVQMKLIQALSAGVPTVATPAVAARAGVQDGVHVMVADDPDGWVAAVCHLLREGDSNDVLKLSTAGREWAVANHSSAAVRRQLAAAYTMAGQPAQSQCLR
jgi:glycosyltransferase involved in cell wall biosynthesis